MIGLIFLLPYGLMTGNFIPLIIYMGIAVLLLIIVKILDWRFELL